MLVFCPRCSHMSDGRSIQAMLRDVLGLWEQLPPLIATVSCTDVRMPCSSTAFPGFTSDFLLEETCFCPPYQRAHWLKISILASGRHM